MEIDQSKLRIEAISEWDEQLLAAATSLEREAFGEGGMNEWFLPAFIRHGRVYCLWVGTELGGVAELMRDWDDITCAYLFGIALHPRWRGRGLGTRFLTAVLKDLSYRGFRRVLLTVDPANSPAVHVYMQKLGFTKKDFNSNEYGQGEDRLLLELDLTAKRRG